MIKKIYLILFAIAMVATIYYNGMNMPVAKYISMAIYAFLFVVALIKNGSRGKVPSIFKSWLMWLTLACVLNLLMSMNRFSFEQIINLEIAMPLMVAFSAYYLFDIKRENLPYYMLPICAISAYFAVISVLSGIGGFVVDEFYEADVVKNQIGAAFTSIAIICLAFMLEIKQQLFKIGYGILSIFCLYPALFFSCRTALLSYLAISVIIVFRNNNKGLILIGVAIGAYALFASNSLEALFYDSVVGRRDVTDMDNLTSGRVTNATQSLRYFFAHPIFGFYGSGDSYNQMPNNAHMFLLYRLTKWGILGAIPFIAIYFSLFKIMIKSFQIKNLLISGALLLAFLESLSEYSPPFGPGSCFTVMFVLIGYFLHELGPKSRV